MLQCHERKLNLYSLLFVGIYEHVYIESFVSAFRLMCDFKSALVYDFGPYGLGRQGPESQTSSLMWDIVFSPQTKFRVCELQNG